MTPLKRQASTLIVVSLFFLKMILHHIDGRIPSFSEIVKIQTYVKNSLKDSFRYYIHHHFED